MTKRRNLLPKSPQGGVELLLTQRVPDLGEQGDLVAVKPGYARNFLLPQGLATIATEHNKRRVEKHRAKLRELAEARLTELKEIAERLQRHSVTIEANANEEGHLYGSVGAPEIAKALQGEGFQVEEDQLRLEGPLKELGLYTVRLHVGQDVEADVKVWVVPAAGEAG
ncbi:MAG: 50S ribosomal protein L9 [Pirellulales bacterium]